MHYDVREEAGRLVVIRSNPIAVAHLLERHGARATFFIITSRVAGNEELLRRMVAADHELGNHLFRDEPSVQVRPEEFERQLLSSDALLSPFGPVRWVRPGSGRYDSRMLETIARHGYRCALGSVYPFDPQISPAPGFGSEIAVPPRGRPEGCAWPETYNVAVDRADFERTIQTAIESAPPEAVAVYLYGSRARGTSSPGSDVDLGLLLRSVPPSTLRSVALDLEGSVERAVGVPVEVVVLNTASADLVHRVLRDGVLLLDRDRPSRIRFEVQSRNEYFDLEPLRRLYRRPA
jgi:uncharacterized protein